MSVGNPASHQIPQRVITTIWLTGFAAAMATHPEILSPIAASRFNDCYRPFLLYITLTADCPLGVIVKVADKQKGATVTGSALILFASARREVA
jgi:hypothetical protein